MATKPIMEKRTVTKYERSEGGYWQLDLDGTHRVFSVYAHMGDDFIPITLTEREVKMAVAYMETWLQEKQRKDRKANGEE